MLLFQVVRRFVARLSLIAAAVSAVGVPVVAQESLYVADKAAGQVLHYALPSTTGTAVGVESNPELYGLATGAAGQLYTVNNTGNLIRRYDVNGSLAAGFGTGGEVDIMALTSSAAYGPVGVAFTPASGGALVVSAYNSGHLLRLDATTGAWDTSFGVGGLLATTAAPLGVAFTAAGDYIYYTQTDASVWRVAADGTGQSLLSLGGAAPLSTWALSLLSDTELFLTDMDAGEVLKYDVSGLNATLDPSYGIGGRVSLPGAYGIALSPTGTAFVTTTGGVVSMISADGSSVQDFVTDLSGPTGIALYGAAGVPEIDPSALPAVAGIITAVAGLLERRRRSGRRGQRGSAGSLWTIG